MSYKLSPSSLNLMQECPRCFWLDKHEKFKRPRGIFPSLPSGIDSILKKHFDKFMKKCKLPPELCDNKECKNLKLFDEENLLSVWRNNLKGVSWADKEGNILHGAVDNILVNKKNQKLIVLDYKTLGFPLKEDTASHYQLQLDVYSFLLKQNDYETEDFAYLLFYVPKEVLETGEFIFNTELVKIQVNAEKGEKIFKEALKLLNEPCPKKHTENLCPWCGLFDIKS
jgi:hypothetical protein